MTSKDKTPGADAKLNSITTRQAALIAAGAAVISAVLSATATIITASLTAKAARDDFLREERRPAYAKFLADERALQSAELPLESAIMWETELERDATLTRRHIDPAGVGKQHPDQVHLQMMWPGPALMGLR